MVTRRLGIPAQHHPNITFYTIVPPPHMFFNTEPATVKEILKLIFLLLTSLLVGLKIGTKVLDFTTPPAHTSLVRLILRQRLKHHRLP